VLRLTSVDPRESPLGYGKHYGNSGRNKGEPLFTELPRETVQKPRTRLQPSLTGYHNGTFRPVLAFVYRPKSKVGALLLPFSDSFRRAILGNLALGIERLLGS
jgi:hypothetical protein